MKKLFLLSVILLFGFVSAQAQLKLGIGGGFSFVQSPDYFTSENDLDFNSEYHLGLKAKLSIPLIPFTPVGFVKYHMLAGEGTTPVLGNFNSESNIVSIGLGGEMSLIPGPISPYLSVDLAMNIINDIELTYDTPQTINLPGTDSYSDLSRFGINIGAGAEITVLPINFDVQLKYNFINLVGKDDGEESIGILTLSAYILFSSN